MKRIFFAASLLLIPVMLPLPAAASPQANLEKLAAASQNPNNLLEPVLNDAELDEIAAFVKNHYKKSGTSLTDKQAYVIAGQMAGMKGLAEYMKNAFSGAAPQRAKPAQQEIQKTASGVMTISAEELYERFNQNEFAARKTFGGKEAVIFGAVKTVDLSPYTPDGKPKVGAPKVPTVRIHPSFIGYFTEKTSFDFSTLQPNEAVHLYCKDLAYTGFNVQGVCEVFATYKLADGKYVPTYTNDTLKTRLTTPPTQ